MIRRRAFAYRTLPRYGKASMPCTDEKLRCWLLTVFYRRKEIGVFGRLATVAETSIVDSRQKEENPPPLKLPVSVSPTASTSHKVEGNHPRACTREKWWHYTVTQTRQLRPLSGLKKPQANNGFGPVPECDKASAQQSGSRSSHE
ncbi:hypothetical protein BaRGS_00016888 [Batillaria attramentaria]|uniref:Uncharacterized protein n=1 Tax=Batillaria attramentaria TaxID=370345 RepID=A0ABD0KXI0_9CAEN